VGSAPCPPIASSVKDAMDAPSSPHSSIGSFLIRKLRTDWLGRFFDLALQA
jgi:hypothetical protein